MAEVVRRVPGAALAGIAYLSRFMRAKLFLSLVHRGLVKQRSLIFSLALTPRTADKSKPYLIARAQKLVFFGNSRMRGQNDMSLFL